MRPVIDGHDDVLWRLHKAGAPADALLTGGSASITVHALGSVLDGATVPAEVPDAAAYPRVLAALEAAGFEGGELDRVASGNRRRVLAAAWGTVPL